MSPKDLEHIKNFHRHQCKNFPKCTRAAYMYQEYCYKCFVYKKKSAGGYEFRTKSAPKINSVDKFEREVKRIEHKKL